jgi:hypothetical protein
MLDKDTSKKNSMLKKRIKKTLIETKDNKERSLIEEQIVKNRISILLEGIESDREFKNLPEKEQLKLSFKVLIEMSYLQTNGLINEQNFGNILKSLFGGWFGNAVQTFIEPILKQVLVPLFGEGYITNFVISMLTKNPAEFIRAINDCKLMTKLVAQSISESIVMQVMNSKGLDAPGYTFLRNSMGDALTSSGFVKSIETGLGDTVCKLLGKFTGNATKVAEKLKNSGSSVSPSMA